MLYLCLGPSQEQCTMIDAGLNLLLTTYHGRCAVVCPQ